MECFDKLPIWSAVALLITWLGVGFYCHKMYQGLEAAIVTLSQVMPGMVPMAENAQTGLVALTAIMMGITLVMAIVGTFATTHCRGTFRNGHCHCPSKISKMRTRAGSSIACTIFLVLNYLLYICWILIFAATVAIITVYYAFSPICLPKAGHEQMMCFNFSKFAFLMAKGNPHAAVELSLCGFMVDKFCQLTVAFTPWYLGAFIGCFLILIGLNHFTACLAANFAHNRRAGQFVQYMSRSNTPEASARDSVSPMRNGISSPALSTPNLNDSKKQLFTVFNRKAPPIYTNSVYGTVESLVDSPRARRIVGDNAEKRMKGSPTLVENGMQTSSLGVE